MNKGCHRFLANSDTSLCILAYAKKLQKWDELWNVWINVMLYVRSLILYLTHSSSKLFSWYLLTGYVKYIHLSNSTCICWIFFTLLELDIENGPDKSHEFALVIQTALWELLAFFKGEILDFFNSVEGVEFWRKKWRIWVVSVTMMSKGRVILGGQLVEKGGLSIPCKVMERV